MKQDKNTRNPTTSAPTPQAGALCYRVQNGKVQYLLITTRRSGKWMTPKGNMMSGKPAHKVAEIEAFEEAGALGKIKNDCVGEFVYTSKSRKSRGPTLIALYPLKVKMTLDKFPERKQRRRKWFSRKKAISMVKNKELAQILGAFDPKS
jgi:8-oxo-dGTP pyrophosphatase MutT (NUDIX family)